MNEQKYTFHPDLKPYETQKAILIPAVDRVLQALMGVQYGMEKGDDAVCVTQYRIPAEDGANLRLLLYAPKQCTVKRPACSFSTAGALCSTPRRIILPWPVNSHGSCK